MTHQRYREIAGLAWHVVKDPRDPEFGGCAGDHQNKLAYKVESVHKSGKCEDQFDEIAAKLIEMPWEEWGPYIAGLKAPKVVVEPEATRYPEPRTDNEVPPVGISPILNEPVLHPVHADDILIEEHHSPKEGD